MDRKQIPQSGIQGIHWNQRSQGSTKNWRVNYKEKNYGNFYTVEEAAAYLEKVKEAIAKGEPVPEREDKKVRAQSGVVGVRYKAPHGKAGTRPWEVVYREKTYGGFPSVEEAAEYRKKLVEALESGKPAPVNPYFGKRASRSGQTLGDPGQVWNSGSGILGIHKIEAKGRTVFRVAYKGKKWGQYSSLEEARNRLDEVIRCFETGQPVPPGPMDLIKKQAAEKRAAEAERKRRYQEDLQALRKRKREEQAAEQAEARKAAQMAKERARDQIRTNDDGWIPGRRKSNPKPEPENMPKFKGRTKAERDQAACRACYYSAQALVGDGLKAGSVCCMYGIMDGNPSRVRLHYERTGSQNLATMTHGENCTEWTPKKRKRDSTFTVKNDQF